MQLMVGLVPWLVWLMPPALMADGLRSRAPTLFRCDRGASALAAAADAAPAAAAARMLRDRSGVFRSASPYAGMVAPADARSECSAHDSTCLLHRQEKQIRTKGRQPIEGWAQSAPSREPAQPCS
jgi:hypothetical protein